MRFLFIKISESEGVVTYVSEKDKEDGVGEQAFMVRMAAYKIIRHEASLFIYHKQDGRLLCHFKPFDNTFLVCDPEGYAVAAEFGTKRFPVGSAYLGLTAAQLPEVKAIKFERDLDFPLVPLLNEAVIPYKVVSLPELVALKNNNERLYHELAELFARCADFTPGKKAEYLKGGNQQDKLCRFSLNNFRPNGGIVTEQVFLLAENAKIIGTISATISVNKEETAVYLYDEIVDYFIKLTSKEQAELNDFHARYEALNHPLAANELIPDDERKNELVMIREAIASIVEPKRLELMAPLFSAARQKFIPVIAALQMTLATPALTLSSQVRAFIRAAAGRVSSYVALRCDASNANNYVIHGPCSPYAEMLDRHVKD